MPGDKQWITVTEAAEKSGYSIRNIQKLLEEGLIEGWKPGRDWFTTLDSVIAYKNSVKKGRPKKSD
jgi:excisionase family DNA binding protein